MTRKYWKLFKKSAPKKKLLLNLTYNSSFQKHTYYNRGFCSSTLLHKKIIFCKMSHED